MPRTPPEQLPQPLDPSPTTFSSLPLSSSSSSSPALPPPPPPLHPWDIPEVQCLIFGRYLSTKDRLVCQQVSRQFAFMVYPHLWSTLLPSVVPTNNQNSLSSRSQFASYHARHRHNDYTHPTRNNNNNNNSSNHYSMNEDDNYESGKALIWNDIPPCPSSSLLSHPTLPPFAHSMMQLHAFQIRKVCLHSEQLFDLLVTSQQCYNLVRLEFDNTSCQNTFQRLLNDLIPFNKGLQSIVINGCKVTRQPVSVQLAQSLPVKGLMIALKNLPRLKELSIEGFELYQGMVQELLMDTCPRLEKLAIPNCCRSSIETDPVGRIWGDFEDCRVDDDDGSDVVIDDEDQEQGHQSHWNDNVRRASNGQDNGTLNSDNGNNHQEQQQQQQLQSRSSFQPHQRIQQQHKLTHLTLDSEILPRLPVLGTSPSLTFPSLPNPTVRSATLNLLRQCQTTLVSLSIHLVDWPLDKILCSTIQHCTLLESLSLKGPFVGTSSHSQSLPKDCVSQILNSFQSRQSLISFQAENILFGPEAIESLIQYHSGLQILEFRGTCYTSGNGIELLLEKLTALKRFRLDIESTTWMIQNLVDGRKILEKEDQTCWKCLSIQDFSFGISTFAVNIPWDLAQEMFYFQISKLKRLKRLKLQNCPGYIGEMLSMKVSDGLNLLKSLQDLEVLDILEIKHGMDQKEVEFLANHFPNLKTLVATFRPGGIWGVKVDGYVNPAENWLRKARPDLRIVDYGR